jgi:hypothetical protein
LEMRHVEEKTLPSSCHSLFKIQKDGFKSD